MRSDQAAFAPKLKYPTIEDFEGIKDLLAMSAKDAFLHSLATSNEHLGNAEMLTEERRRLRARLVTFLTDLCSSYLYPSRRYWEDKNLPDGFRFENLVRDLPESSLSGLMDNGMVDRRLAEKIQNLAIFPQRQAVYDRYGYGEPDTHLLGHLVTPIVRSRELSKFPRSFIPLLDAEISRQFPNPVRDSIQQVLLASIALGCTWRDPSVLRQLVDLTGMPINHILLRLPSLEIENGIRAAHIAKFVSPGPYEGKRFLVESVDPLTGHEVRRGVVKDSSEHLEMRFYHGDVWVAGETPEESWTYLHLADKTGELVIHPADFRFRVTEF